MRNNESTTTEPSPWNVQRLKPQGWIFTLDSAVVKTQHLFNFGLAYNLEYAAPRGGGGYSDIFTYTLARPIFLG